MHVYAIGDLTSGGFHPLGDYVDVFVRREDAEQFVENVRRDDQTLADTLEIVDRSADSAANNSAAHARRR